MNIQQTSNGVQLIVGCNYHTRWQSKAGMRFVLKSFDMATGKAVLLTRKTGRTFTTKINDLIFIDSAHNRAKAVGLTVNFNQAYLNDLLRQG